LTGSGTATQIAYWNAASTLTGSGNLWWDNTNTRLGVGTGAPATAIHGVLSDAGTNTVAVVGTLGHNTSGVPAAGYGGGLKFALESSTTVDRDAAQVSAIWTTATDATRTAALTFSTTNAGTLSEAMRLTGNNLLGVNNVNPQATVHGITTDAGTNAVVVTGILGHNTSGVAAAGFGNALKFTIQSSTTVDRDAAQIGTLWTTATDASRTSALTFSTVNNAVLSENMRILGSGFVGINQTTPTQLLEVRNGNLLLSNSATAGQVQLQGTSTGISTFQAGAQGATNVNYTLPVALPTTNQVLTATGVAGSAVTLGWGAGGGGASGWALTGNATTTPGTNFVGTTDATALMLSTNGTERMRLASGTTITLGVQGTGATAPPSSFTFGAAGYTAASSTNNQAGTDLNIQSGAGTGSNSASGNILFLTPMTGASGAAAQVFAERMRLTTTDIMSLGARGTGAAPPPTSFGILAAGWTGASSAINSAGTDINFTSGPGTGNSVTNGHFIFSAPVATASGTAVQATAERMRLTNTGSLGIGATSPGQRLHVAGGNVLIDTSAASTAGQLQFENPARTFISTSQVLSATGVAGSAVTLGWATNGAGGGWGITGNGGTTPTSNFIGTTDANALVVRTNNAEAMRVGTSNSVTLGLPGSGATTPPSNFTIGSAGWTSVSTSNNQAGTDLTIQSGPGTGSSTSGGKIVFNTTPAGSSGTAVQTQTERMRITADGLVGINTTTPTNQLEVAYAGTTDEVAAVNGGATGTSAANQSVGVWGKATNSSTTNTGTIGVLASGNGNTTAGQTNIALQINSGELSMGRTTETGTNYTVVDNATGGTVYTAQGPSGAIEIDIRALFGVANFTTTPRVATVTINNRYFATTSIVLTDIIEKTFAGAGTNPNSIQFVTGGRTRSSGSYTLEIWGTGGNVAVPNTGSTLTLGYVIVNPSK
jgi:hypothetical protein